MNLALGAAVAAMQDQFGKVGEVMVGVLFAWCLLGFVLLMCAMKTVAKKIGGLSPPPPLPARETNTVRRVRAGTKLE